MIPMKLNSWPKNVAALLLLIMLAVVIGLPLQASAQPAESSARMSELTLQAQFWIDETGQTKIDVLSTTSPDPFKPLSTYRSFALNSGSALWLRVELPVRPDNSVDYLRFSSAAFFDRASIFQRNELGQWSEQRAGDRLDVAQWDYPDQTPVFHIATQAASTVWLRLENVPASIAPRLHLLSEASLFSQRRWSYMLLGGYFGFGFLVFFLGIVHVRLYRDRAFVAYSAYVAFMLLFQLAFTGMGGLFFWSNWAAFNNAAPAIFMLLLTATGIWFVREACALQRHSKLLDKTVMGWVASGVIFSVVYTVWTTRNHFLLLNLYGLFSVQLSIALCIWVWRRGERYGGWLFLGFLPVHLGYPFPALRSAGVIADNWLSQYAVLIGSAIEIPLLLYILHKRAKEFGDNSARMRAIDHTDPLTGLAIEPVLKLRLRDALKRGTISGQHRSLILVELANHAEISNEEGHIAGDRALVVAASYLLSTCDELDTVCRIDTARFAMLIETKLGAYQRTVLAQRIIARGLAEFAESNTSLPLRFRVVTAELHPDHFSLKEGQPIELEDALQPLVQAMDKLAEEPKKSITHVMAERSLQTSTEHSAD